MSAAFDLCPARPQAPLPGEPFHRWASADGQPWLAFYRQDGGYLLRFSGLADFTMDASGLRITCTPAPDVSAATLDHLYLNQILPLARSARRELSFHGSAVVIAGRAAAFIGPSGRGKSTLAASFAQCGRDFLTDDGLIVTPRADGYAVEPSHPSIRLWEDSERAVLPAGVGAAPAIDYSPKSRLLAGDQLRHRASPCPLAALFFLDDGGAATIRISGLSPPAAMVELLKNTFRLDIEDKAALSHEFDAVAALCARVPAFRLDFPRRFAELAAVRAAVEATVEESPRRS